MIWAFDSPAEIFKPKTEDFIFKVRIEEENFFFKNFKFGQILLRSTGVQFRRTCQKVKAKVSLFLCLRADKIGKPIHFSAKSFFFKCFLDTKKAILTTPRQSFCYNLIFFLSLSEKSRRKLIKASEKLFSSKFSYGHCNAVSTLLLFCLLLQSTFSSVQTSKKGQKCTHFSRITFIIFPRSVFWTRELQFWQRRRKQIAKLRTFFHSEFQTGRRKFIVSKKLLSLRMIHVTPGMQY